MDCRLSTFMLFSFSCGTGIPVRVVAGVGEHCYPRLAGETARPHGRWLLLDYHFSRHLGMDRAEIVVGAGLIELEGELLIRVQRTRLDRSLVIAHNGVGNVVVIHP